MVGRPKGTPKTGGRQKGAPNKPTFDLRAVRPPGEITPLSFMFGILGNKDASDKDRKWAARFAAPYVHPRMRPALAAVAAGAGKVTVEILRLTNEESLLQIERDAQAVKAALDKNAPDPGRMWAAKAAAPYCHPEVQPTATNAGGVDVQVRQITHEEALAELDALGDPRPLAGIDKNNGKQYQPVEQAPATENALDRLEAQWFNMDNPGAAHEPALPPQMSSPSPMPAPTPTPPPPVALPHPGNGAGQPQRMNGQAQRVNGTSRPRPGNGAVPRPNPEELRGIRPKPRTWRDYPRTHPVHGIV